MSENEMPWGDVPYDHKTPAVVVHDFAVVRGDLSEPYARNQLAGWIERYADAATTKAKVEVLDFAVNTLQTIAAAGTVWQSERHVGAESNRIAAQAYGKAAQLLAEMADMLREDVNAP